VLSDLPPIPAVAVELDQTGAVFGPITPAMVAVIASIATTAEPPRQAAGRLESVSRALAEGHAHVYLSRRPFRERT
jgi:hypothetical protein